jgi:acyl carrier protein
MSNTWMTEEQIQEKFAAIVAQSLHIDSKQVVPDVHLDDLGAESLDLIEISMEVESQFRVWLPEKSILQTAIETYGPDVIEHDGHLTQMGKTLLEARMPAEDASHFEGEVSLKDVNQYFLLVSTWIRMIDGLLSFTPAACSSCGGALEASLGFRLKCANCGAETTLRSGDEINREWVEEFKKTQPGEWGSSQTDPQPAAV